MSDDTAQAAGEGMSEERTPSWYDDAPITDEQLDSVRRDLTLPVAERGAAFAPFVVRKLLAEVERLRGVEVGLRSQIADEVSTIGEQFEREAALHKRVAQLRARLAEIGETEVEWGYWHEDEFNVSERQFGAGDIRYYRERSGRPVERRLAGDWREVPDA